MIDVEKYIASGILEQFVAGTLSEEENLKIQGYANTYPEIRKEIISIEKAILAMTKTSSPGLSQNSFDKIRDEIQPIIPLVGKEHQERKSWLTVTGWAACLLFAATSFWMYLKNEDLKTEVEVVNQKNSSLENQILVIRNNASRTKSIWNQLRVKNVSVISLGGQTAAPEAFAKVYWDQNTNKVFIDSQGLPDPPSGYDYQVWSLKLNPLTPTSIGLLNNYSENTDRIFELENPNDSEAFGITLEPKGGSKTPTLEQLYTLGTVGP